MVISEEDFKRVVLHRLKTHAFCRIQPSKTNGVGVFAVKDIPANTYPWHSPNHHLTYGTHLYSNEELAELDEPIRKMLYDYNLKSEEGLLLYPHELEVMHITQFLNASKDPNLDFLVKKDGKFITNREIKAGEELTVDYKKVLKNTYWRYNYDY
jgi:SET domain-containing protein